MNYAGGILICPGAIRDVGNFYRHAYDNVLEDRVGAQRKET